MKRKKAACKPKDYFRQIKSYCLGHIACASLVLFMKGTEATNCI